MQLGVRFSKLLRPETLILVVLPTTYVVLLALLGMFSSHRFGAGFWLSFVYLKMFGWHWSCLLGSIALGYLAFSVAVWAIQRRQSNRQTAGDSPVGRYAQTSVERLQAARSLVGVIAFYAFACTLHFLALNALCQPSCRRVIWANDFLMRLDHLLFGSYVPFEAQEQPVLQMLARPFLFSYVNLTQVVLLVLLTLCVFNYRCFRHFCLAFFAVIFLALPCCFALPAITPDEAYRLNKPHARIPLDIALETADPIIHLNPEVARFLSNVEPGESDPSQGVFLVTSFPSMHVAWGMLAVWFGCTLYEVGADPDPLGDSDAIGAVFTLQHYAVDAIAGMVTAAIAVLLVRWLLAIEARRGLSPPKGYEIAGFMCSDAVTIARRLGGSFFPRSLGTR